MLTDYFDYRAVFFLAFNYSQKKKCGLNLFTNLADNLKDNLYFIVQSCRIQLVNIIMNSLSLLPCLLNRDYQHVREY